MSILRASKGFLLLEDGTLFHGRIQSASNTPAVAEVVFTTNMSGYQEVFTDPSYRSQIVVMTSPMIGNYGVNGEDPESTKAQVSGVVVRELSTTFSNWRAGGGLAGYMANAKIPILYDVDTRRLTRHLRTVGVLRGVIGAGAAPDSAAKAALDACPSMEGLDLASVVTTEKPYTWGKADAARHIVAFDYGIKQNILRLFEDRDCRVTVVPSTTTAKEVLALKPDGVFLSNGPGDPRPLAYAIGTIRELLGIVPVFGICLGHQIMALASGAKTFKMKFGHHGANHPVKDLDTGRVSITSQNHGFAVDEKTLPANLRATHVSLFDGTLQGLARTDKPAFCFQGHPEASPGPHDIAYLFDRFIKEMEAHA